MKGPVGFLVGTVGGWAMIRAVMLWPDDAAEAEVAPRDIAWQAPLPVASTPLRVAEVVAQPIAAPRYGVMTSVALAQPISSLTVVVPEKAARTPRPAASASPPPDAVASVTRSPPARHIDRLSLSSWTIVRGAGGSGLAAAGQLGGSQAGFRARYDLGSGVAVAVRVSGPLGSRRGKEAALAIDWRPVGALPVTFTVERRVGLDAGGRDAFAAGVFGGFYGRRLPFGLQLDGYGQAGVVGLKARDAYVDAAIRAERTVIGRGRSRIGVGAGLWGGAQPGLSRLDVGPQIVAHAPLGSASVRIGAEWRQRVAGDARPGTGPALTIGADF